NRCFDSLNVLDISNISVLIGFGRVHYDFLSIRLSDRSVIFQKRCRSTQLFNLFRKSALKLSLNVAGILPFEFYTGLGGSCFCNGTSGEDWQRNTDYEAVELQ